MFGPVSWFWNGSPQLNKPCDIMGCVQRLCRVARERARPGGGSDETVKSPGSLGSTVVAMVLLLGPGLLAQIPWPAAVACMHPEPLRKPRYGCRGIKTLNSEGRFHIFEKREPKSWKYPPAPWGCSQFKQAGSDGPGQKF